jgi:deoxyribonuclease IV
MPKFGAHMSIAGGFHKAVAAATALGMETLQIFTNSPSQWVVKPVAAPVGAARNSSGGDGLGWHAPELAPEAVEPFVEAVRASGLEPVVAHTSYLINLASPDAALWRKSLEALVVEWQRAELLGLSGLVMHPGAHVDSPEEAGQQRIVQAVSEVIARVRPRRCRLLFENTAGQGTCLGWRFSQLGFLLRQLAAPAAVGVCLDTCHALAAGYDLTTAGGLKAMVAELDREVGLEQVHVVHINDSKKGCGSRVDRHEHIGLGMIGEAAFGRFLKCSAFKHLPMILETPKGTDPATGEDWDAQNLATLRRLARTSRKSPLSETAN